MTVRRRLEGVTLCAIESRPSSAILDALRASLELVECDEALLLSSVRPSRLPEGVRHRPIPEFQNVAEYSSFVLTKLEPLIETTHVLLIQWDGFVLDGDAWDPDFLSYDYIGAPWPHFAPPHNVGNGGFSLRSKALLRAIGDPGFQMTLPEDVAICRVNRAFLEAKHDIRFAPAAVAARFSHEHGSTQVPSFGFHGLFNFPDIYGARLEAALDALDDLLLHNRDARTLCLRLLSSPRKTDRAIGRRFLWRLVSRTPWNSDNWKPIRMLAGMRWPA